jgi:hypothetical protein
MKKNEPFSLAYWMRFFQQWSMHNRNGFPTTMRRALALVMATLNLNNKLI